MGLLFLADKPLKLKGRFCFSFEGNKDDMKDERSILNFTAFDYENSKLLEESYEAIKNKNSIRVITDLGEKDKVLQRVINSIRTPARTKEFSFQNLFKLELPSGHFYIAHCLIGFGVPMSTYGFTGGDDKYIYQIIGFAKTKMDIGNTYLRPETFLDEVVGLFVNSDINFENAQKFNHKYYLISYEEEYIMKEFDKKFLDTIAKYDDVILYSRNEEIYISFAVSLNKNQGAIIEDIFSNFKFLTDWK
ncbi:MAG: hypothetical protein NTX03_11540 [Bacteroidetes bacterium]|nr:hypothetical protein [Bacteroidota bacterium]